MNTVIYFEKLRVQPEEILLALKSGFTVCINGGNKTAIKIRADRSDKQPEQAAVVSDESPLHRDHVPDTSSTSGAPPEALEKTAHTNCPDEKTLIPTGESSEEISEMITLPPRRTPHKRQAFANSVRRCTLRFEEIIEKRPLRIRVVRSMFECDVEHHTAPPKAQGSSSLLPEIQASEDLAAPASPESDHQGPSSLLPESQASEDSVATASPESDNQGPSSLLPEIQASEDPVATASPESGRQEFYSLLPDSQASEDPVAPVSLEDTQPMDIQPVTATELNPLPAASAWRFEVPKFNAPTTAALHPAPIDTMDKIMNVQPTSSPQQHVVCWYTQYNFLNVQPSTSQHVAPMDTKNEPMNVQPTSVQHVAPLVTKNETMDVQGSSSDCDLGKLRASERSNRQRDRQRKARKSVTADSSVHQHSCHHIRRSSAKTYCEHCAAMIIKKNKRKQNGRIVTKTVSRDSSAAPQLLITIQPTPARTSRKRRAEDDDDIPQSDNTDAAQPKRKAKRVRRSDKTDCSAPARTDGDVDSESQEQNKVPRFRIRFRLKPFPDRLKRNERRSVKRSVAPSLPEVQAVPVRPCLKRHSKDDQVLQRNDTVKTQMKHSAKRVRWSDKSDCAVPIKTYRNSSKSQERNKAPPLPIRSCPKCRPDHDERYKRRSVKRSVAPSPPKVQAVPMRSCLKRRPGHDKLYKSRSVKRSVAPSPPKVQAVPMRSCLKRRPDYHVSQKGVMKRTAKRLRWADTVACWEPDSRHCPYSMRMIIRGSLDDHRRN